LSAAIVDLLKLIREPGKRLDLLTGTYHWKGRQTSWAGSYLSAQTSLSATGQWELSVVFLPIGPVWPFTAEG
jgi:hypothetical protein